MKATRKGRPSVVFPRVRNETRGLALSSAVKYSVICFQLGRWRSAPGSNPRMLAGLGIAGRVDERLWGKTGVAIAQRAQTAMRTERIESIGSEADERGVTGGLSEHWIGARRSA